MSTATLNQPSINDTFPNNDMDIGGYDPTTAERKFPAEPRPGVHTFTFSLQNGEGYEQEPFVTIEKGPQDARVNTLAVNYKATYTFEKKDGTQGERTLNFLSANFYTTPKMREKGITSEGARLLAALGYNEATDGKFSVENVRTFLHSADAQRLQFRAKTGLRYYHKDSDTTWSTNPRKNGDEQRWPKTDKGEWTFYLTEKNTDGKVKGQVPGKVTLLEFYKVK